jgi:hypothetical protein
MANLEQDAEREERITMEIVVDAYGPEEQAMGWYYYLQDTMQFPFTAVVPPSDVFLLSRKEQR